LRQRRLPQHAKSNGSGKERVSHRADLLVG
jgi:hypothetical protein